MEVVAFVTGAHVASQEVQAVVAAVVPIVQTLVHVDTILLVLRQQDVAGGALAIVSPLRVHADVRTAQIHVILEFLALVDILASSLILFQSESQRAGAVYPLATFLAMTMMRTVSVVLLATVDQPASFIVILQHVSGGTGTVKRSYQVRTGMGAPGVRILAFVHVVAESGFNGVRFESFVAAALEPALRIRAPVRAIVQQFETLVDIDASSVIVPRQFESRRTLAGDRPVEKGADIGTASVVDETFVRIDAQKLVVPKDHVVRAQAERLSVLVAAVVGTTTVPRQTSISLHANGPVLRQYEIRWTGARDSAVLVAAIMGATSVIRVTLVLLRASGVVFVQNHPWRAETGDGAVLVMAQVGATAVVDQAFVYLHARLPVILQQFVIIRASALDAALDVGAQMGASAVVLDALVHVLAGPSIVGQSIPVRAPTLVASIRVDAGMGAAVVHLVARLLALVPVQAVPLIILGQNVAGRAPALKPATHHGHTLVGAAVFTRAKINFLARPTVRAQLPSCWTLALVATLVRHARVAAIVPVLAPSHCAGPIVLPENQVLRTGTNVSTVQIFAPVGAAMKIFSRALVHVPARLPVLDQLVAWRTGAVEAAFGVDAIVGATPLDALVDVPTGCSILSQP